MEKELTIRYKEIKEEEDYIISDITIDSNLSEDEIKKLLLKTLWESSDSWEIIREFEDEVSKILFTSILSMQNNGPLEDFEGWLKEYEKTDFEGHYKSFSKEEEEYIKNHMKWDEEDDFP